MPRCSMLTIAAPIAVGLVWLAGAAFNAGGTLRQEDPYAEFARSSHLPVYRWFFDQIMGARPAGSRRSVGPPA